MALQPCWRCMSRLSLNRTSQSSSSRVSQRTTVDKPRLFSTSPPHYRDGKTRTLKLTRKKRTKTYKIPGVGERKALRKRVVLSNSNALRVDGLKEWSRSAIANPELLGHVVALADESLDGLRTLESFKPCQGWGMFNRPSTLLRRETMELVRALDDSGLDTVRRFIVGARGCGKSVMLLQAHAAALMKGWVVIHFPEGRDLSSATTAYSPIPKTTPTQYSQPTYTAALLGRVAKANAAVLSGLTMQLDHSNAVSTPLQSNMSLYRLAETGSNDPDNAWSIFQALWAELTISNANIANTTANVPPGESEDSLPKSQPKKSKGSKNEVRPPVMLSLDGLAPVSRLSSYLAPDMHHIHSHDLSLVSHFMSYLCGAASLPNGGAVLAADSLSTRPLAPTVDLAIKQSEARDAARLLGSTTGVDTDSPLYDPDKPFDRQDERVLRALRSVPVMRLEGFGRDEARNVLEYYAKSGMLRAKVTDALVSEKWAVSGGGLIGELERSSVGTGHM